jgi:SAM-dependent methyltransferase
MAIEPPGPRSPARRRFEALPEDAPREAWFEALRELVREAYLADPADPYRGSGRGSGAARWEESRRCIVDAVDRDADFMDVGCANGLLLESLVGWAAEKGHVLTPHGIDFVPELIVLARKRLPAFAANLEVANAFYWLPRRRYDFVRVSLECMRRPDWKEYLERMLELAVAPGGRLVVCWYYPSAEPAVDVEPLVRGLGLRPAGRSAALGTSLVWVDG